MGAKHGFAAFLRLYEGGRYLVQTWIPAAECTWRGVDELPAPRLHERRRGNDVGGAAPPSLTPSGSVMR